MLIKNESIVNGCERAYKVQQLHRIFEKNLLSSSCRRCPAVICDDQNLTFSELNHSANRMANLLIEKIQTCELRPNQDGDWIIAVCMPPSNDFIITLLAILKTGAAYLPMDVTFPQNRIDHILQEAKPVLVIYDSEAIEGTSFGSTEALSITECRKLSSKHDDENIEEDRTIRSADANSLALVLYTSGSTGVPKGVRLPHSAVMNRLHWQWETFPFSSTEQICAFKTAITFVDSLSEIWGPLLAKKTLLVVPKNVTKDPSQLVTLLQKYGIERLVLVPTLLKSILIYLSFNQDAKLLRKLKLWVCSGETLPISLANEFFDYFPRNEYMLCNFYGSTEILGDVTYFICRDKDQLRDYENNVPIGTPVFNTTIYILDSNRNPVEIGETGELFVSGKNLAHGYVNGRDKDRFVENFIEIDSDNSQLYRTGDYASVQKDGIIRYEGRTDSQVKIRGNRVDLSEIQKHLLEIDGVDKAIVLCHHAGQMDQTILAFVSVASPLNSKQKSLRTIQIEDFLRNKLVDYMIPQVIVIDDMPLLVNGKIDRQTLLRMYEDMTNNVTAYDFNGVPENDRQKAGVLFETIREVLGKSAPSSLSLESNFYAIGGNSLNSIYAIAKLRDRGYYIDIADFISAVNLKELLERTKDNDAESDLNSLSNDKNEIFTVVPLKMEHADEAIPLIVLSFTNKGSLNKHIKDKQVYFDLLESQRKYWPSYVDESLSFIVNDKNGRMVGVCLNDPFDFNPLEVCGGAYSVAATAIALTHFLKKQVLDKLPTDKPIFDNNLVGTHESLSAQENIALVTFIEKESVRLAKERNFYGLLALNSNELTQQLASTVFNYETLYEYQVNQFIVDGQQPLAKVPDSTKWVVHWKKV